MKDSKVTTWGWFGILLGITAAWMISFLQRDGRSCVKLDGKISDIVSMCYTRAKCVHGGYDSLSY